jgi:hypothetical protein
MSIQESPQPTVSPGAAEPPATQPIDIREILASPQP